MRQRPILLAFVLVPLAACGHDQPPPLTGNLTDARGAHAGSFRGANAGQGDYGNASTTEAAARNQTAADGLQPDVQAHAITDKERHAGR